MCFDLASPGSISFARIANAESVMWLDIDTSISYV